MDNHIITRQDTRKSLILHCLWSMIAPLVSLNNPVNYGAQEMLRKDSPNLVELDAAIKNKFLRQAFNFLLICKGLEYQFQFFDNETLDRQWCKKRLVKSLTEE